MKRLFVIIFFFVFFRQNLFSQTYYDYFQEFFFDRLPSARIEAMGKILSVSSDSYFASQSNPASIMRTKGLSAFYSHSTPYYLAEDYNFYFGGLSYIFSDVGAFAINFMWSEIGNSYFTYPDGTYKKYTPSKKLLTASYAREIPGIVKIGFNTNLFIDDFNPDKSNNGIFFDLGLLKEFNLYKSSNFEDNVSAGLFAKNIFNQGIDLSNNVVIRDLKEYFPSIVRVGISNDLNYFDKSIYTESHLIGLTTAIEYQNVVNFKYRTAVKFGAELSLLNILFARCGYYNESQLKASNGKGELTDFTYGFGLNMEGSKWIDTNLPLSIMIDYTSLQQPTYIVNFDDWDNFTIFSIRLNYLFE